MQIKSKLDTVIKQFSQYLKCSLKCCFKFYVVFINNLINMFFFFSSSLTFQLGGCTFLKLNVSIMYHDGSSNVI